MNGTAQIARERLSTALAVDRAVQTALSIRNDASEYSGVLSSDTVTMGKIFGGYATDAGANVNEYSAMRVSAVYAAVRLIAGSIATTPCVIYRREDDGSRSKADNHDYWWLFNEQACPRFTAATFWEFMTGQMLLRGDGIAYLVRANPYSTKVTGVVPVRRGNVAILRNGTDRLMYRISDVMPDGSINYFTADQDDVLHFPGLGFDGMYSQSVIGWAARQAIGIAIKADEHAGATFSSGASIQYAVTMPAGKTMTTEQQQLFREAWVAKYSGQGVSKYPLVLTEGLAVQELSMTPADSQLLESRKFQIVDIARAFGVPPHMIGDVERSTSWGTGIEQITIGYVKYALLPHLNRFAQEMNRKLFPVRDRYFVDFNVDALMEGDSKAQAEYFGKALGGPGSQGWMYVNEVRRLKNLPPVEGGDKMVFATPAVVPGAAADTNPDAAGDSADPSLTAEPAKEPA